MSPLRILATILIAILVAACSTPATSRTAGPASPSSARGATPSASASASAGDAWLIVSKQGDPDIRVILDSTLEDIYELPMGAPSTTWGTVITATPSEATTTVEHLVVQPGFDGWSREIDGRWRLPTVGLDPVPVGVSTDGSTIVLVEADAPYGAAGADRTTSRFAVVDGRLALGNEPRIIELSGAFDFDALSPDGTLLYGAQQVPGPLEGRYQV
ncbi:MAG TPA: hypothetical protein VK867_05545, partial [Candidatus Limnocylindrales bacterium]|nr:hypothetical protein [Candidatus Limnocylindrales bacterium]